MTLILYKVLDKSISADENTKTNVTVNQKGCCIVRISRRETLDGDLSCLRGGEGEYGRTCATRDDEPRPVWTRLPITH
jgi:hypothetical protein